MSLKARDISIIDQTRATAATDIELLETVLRGLQARGKDQALCDMVAYLQADWDSVALGCLVAILLEDRITVVTM